MESLSPDKRSPLWFRLYAFVAILVAVGVQFDLWQHLIGGASRVYYVSPAGSNWNYGLTQSSSFRTINRAAGLVRPGDKIVLLPGVYQERVHLKRGGTQEAPVVLEAAEPGTATISWSRPLSEVTGSWQDLGHGLFSCRTETPVYLICEGSNALFRMKFGGVEQLRALVERPHSFPVFFQSDNELFVFLNGRHPSGANLMTHRAVPEPREWGEMKSANLWIEADHLEIRGLQFEFGIGAGIRIWDGQRTVIDDCAFRWCNRGVTDRRGLTQAGQVSIQHCLYENYPQKRWAAEWLSWNELYAHYATTGLVASNAHELFVSYCAVRHCADAMGVSPGPGSRALIKNNWIADVTDDGIELDGDACNVEVVENLIEDCNCSLGLSPVKTGPVNIHHNLFINPADTYNAVFKLLSPFKDDMGNVVGIENLDIQHNVAVGEQLVYWHKTIPVDNVSVRNNMWQVAASELNWPPSALLEENLLSDQILQQVVVDQDLEVSPSIALPDWAKSLIKERLALRHQCGPGWWTEKRLPVAGGVENRVSRDTSAVGGRNP